MDPMLLGETLSATDAEQYLGFWMPASGNEGIAGIEVFSVSAANAFDVFLDTKSSDEDDSDANSGASQIGTVVVSSTTAQVFRFGVSGAQDLVRYRIKAKGSAARLHFQFVQPTWAPN